VLPIWATAWDKRKERYRVKRKEPRAKSIGDINEQAARLSNTARGTRLARISRIAQTYRDNINDRLQSAVPDWGRRANIKMPYRDRIGAPLAYREAEQASKGNTNG